MNKKLYKPIIVNFEVTNKCDLKCSFCYKDLNANFVDINTYKKYILELHKLGTKVINLSGGDPLLHKNIIELIQFGKNLGMKMFLSTSGKSLTEELAQKLKKVKLDKLFISLNGSTKEIHNLSRDGFEYSMNAIKVGVDNGLQVNINFVARNDNINDLNNIIVLSKNMGVEKIYILSNKNNRNGIQSSKLSVEGLHYLEKIFSENEDFLVAENCMYCLGFKNFIPTFNGCVAGKTLLSITSKDEFSPCSHLHKFKHQIESIEDYWFNDKDLEMIRNSKRCFCNIT